MNKIQIYSIAAQCGVIPTRAQKIYKQKCDPFRGNVPAACVELADDSADSDDGKSTAEILKQNFTHHSEKSSKDKKCLISGVVWFHQ